MRGSQIIVTADPCGVWEEGIIGDTSLPGTLMQIQAVTLPIQGRFTWIAAAPGTDGLKGLFAVLLDDPQQGFLPGVAYVAGSRGRLYFPRSGDDVNLLLGEIAGTGNSYAIGDKLIVDAESGLLVPYASTPQDVYAVCMETVTTVTAPNLTWCKKT